MPDEAVRTHGTLHGRQPPGVRVPLLVTLTSHVEVPAVAQFGAGSLLREKTLDHSSAQPAPLQSCMTSTQAPLAFPPSLFLCRPACNHCRPFP